MKYWSTSPHRNAHFVVTGSSMATVISRYARGCIHSASLSGTADVEDAQRASGNMWKQAELGITYGLMGCSMAKAPTNGFVYLSMANMLYTDSLADKVSRASGRLMPKIAACWPYLVATSRTYFLFAGHHVPGLAAVEANLWGQTQPA